MPASDPNCIFCKIIAGTIPCYKIAENAHAISFLDAYPIAEGHCLVLPKEHAAQFHDVSSPEVAADVARLMHQVVHMLREKGIIAPKTTDEEGCYNILQNNGKLAHQAVPHTHFHIIPKSHQNGLTLKNWESKAVEKETLAALAAKITGK